MRSKGVQTEDLTREYYGRRVFMVWGLIGKLGGAGHRGVRA